MEDTTFFLEPVPLTRKEAALRGKLEAEIFQAVRDAYIYIGELLGEIRDKRLYKSTHRSFDDYAPEVLDMAKRSANRYIAAAGVVKNLRAIAHKDETESGTSWSQNSTQPIEIIIPENESQARALVGLTPEEQREVWFEAVETVDGRMTAAHVRKTARDFGYAKIHKAVERAKRAKKENQARMSDDFDTAFRGFLDVVNDESVSRWKTTDRLTVVKYLDALRSMISENGSHRIPDQGYAVEACNIEKLQAAGFTLYRSEKRRRMIEQHDPDIGWIVFETYEDIESMNAALDEIVRHEMNLRG